MQFNGLHFRYVFQDKLYVLVMRFLFKVLEDLQDIIVDVHAVAADDLRNAIRRELVQGVADLSLIQETHIQGQFDREMLGMPFLFFPDVDPGPLSLLSQEINALGYSDKYPDSQVGKQDVVTRDDD